MLKNIKGMYQGGQLQTTEFPQRVINTWSWGVQDQLIANATVMGDRPFSVTLFCIQIFEDLRSLRIS